MPRTEGDHTSRIGDEEHASEAVLRTVAAVSDRPLLDLPPLQEVVDMDALDQLFTSSAALDSIQFSYEGYEITVEQDQVHLSERR